MLSWATGGGARKKPFMDSLKLSSFIGSGLKETLNH